MLRRVSRRPGPDATVVRWVARMVLVLAALAGDLAGAAALTPGLGVSGGAIKGEKLDGFGRIGIRAAREVAPRTDLEVGAYVGIIQLTEESPSVRGLRDEHEVAVGVGVSRRVAPGRDDDLHGWLELRGGITRWRYADPVPPGTEGTDHLPWAALATGVGARLTGPLGIRGGTGIRAYAGSTGDGLDNDLVETALLVELELTWTLDPRR